MAAPSYRRVDVHERLDRRRGSLHGRPCADTQQGTQGHVSVANPSHTRAPEQERHPLGYSQHFTFQPGSRRFADAWPSIVADTNKIVDFIQQSGVALHGPDGVGEPVIDMREGIAINGDAQDTTCYAHHPIPTAATPLLIPAPQLVTATAPADCRVWRHVKTLRLPYDLAVTTILLRAHQLAGASFIIGSDGTWNGEWATPPGANPRDVIAHLFKTRPTSDQLTDVTAGMALGDAGWIDPRLVANSRIL